MTAGIAASCMWLPCPQESITLLLLQYGEGDFPVGHPHFGFKLNNKITALAVVWSKLFKYMVGVNLTWLHCITSFLSLSRDNQTRQMRDAVTNVEKHFGELCQIFAAYIRKTARLRDKADLLVNEIHAYAATETPNLKLGLKNFATEFSKLQDYRQAQV